MTVHCRTGSLEIENFPQILLSLAHCRSGSLAILTTSGFLLPPVHCRTGSLESRQMRSGSSMRFTAIQAAFLSAEMTCQISQSMANHLLRRLTQNYQADVGSFCHLSDPLPWLVQDYS